MYIYLPNIHGKEETAILFHMRVK